MSAKAGDYDDDDNEAYVEDEYVEDDDDDEEDDFHPGGDDDDDDDDEDYDDYEEEEDNVENGEVSYLDGVLTYDAEGQTIQYKGNGFHLESTDPVTFNILDKACKPPLDNNKRLHIIMMGPCDVVTPESSGRKPAPRKIKVTFMIADPYNGDGIGYDNKNLKDSDANDEGEKKPSVFYQVYGSEMDNPEYGIDFNGSFAPIIISGSGTNEIRLLCQVRMPNPNTKAASSTNVVSTTGNDTLATSAAVGKRGNNINDDDDNIDDVDEDGIDHNELIALHEEARLTTEALKKRYRGPSMDDKNNGDRDDDDEKMQRKASDRIGTSKKVKTDDVDDDDDIEF